MDNEFQKKKTDTKGKNKQIGLIMFSSLTLLLLFIGELYVMVIMQKEGLIEVALIGVAILVFAYLDLSAVMKWIHMNEEEREEQYAGMLKAEKASYLLIRKYFDEIEEQLVLMEDKVSDPFQEIVAAQKATAKVTINRNKENTDALMNSNDKLLDIIFGMESKIDELSGTFSGGSHGESEGFRESNAALEQKQAEMSKQMKELEMNLKSQMSRVVSEISGISSKIASSSGQAMSVQQPVAGELEPLDDIEVGDLGALGDLEDFATLEADVSADDLEASEPEETVAPLPEDEPLSGLEPLPGLEPLSEPEPVGEPEPLAELGPLSGPEEMEEPEPLGELESLPELEPEGEFEPIPEPEAEPEKPPMPDLSDPNRAMSPDEIAALFANLG